MARFANTPARPQARKAGSIGSFPTPTRTHQGGKGFIASDPEAELFTTAVSGFLADGFYEKADAQLARVVGLVGQCDPIWLAQFIPWLRDGANMRSAPLVVAAEYGRAGFPNRRHVVASSMQRADEPAELLGYWRSTYGRNLPKWLQRGVADACARLYTERSLLRYDGGNRGWRFGDVIEVVHPTPKNDAQSALFRFALDRRRHSDTVASPVTLPRISRTLMLDDIPQERRSLATVLGDPLIEMSWERASTWLGRTLDKGDWAALIPSMGYMALLRNLNNFDRAGITVAARDIVYQRLTDAEEIGRSRVLPFRFQTAYKNLEADTYKVALTLAADASLMNLPTFPGRTLIMVDCSGSMSSAVGGGKSRNPLTRSEAAGFYAEALARRCHEAVISCYDYNVLSAHTPKGHAGVLLAASDPRYRARGGTQTWHCLNQALSRFRKGEVDRVVILTDEQSSDGDQGVPIPVVTWNLAGYAPFHAAHGTKNRISVGGYSDQVLQTLPAVIERSTSGRWPWE